MDDERNYQRLAIFIRAWFSVTLNKEGRRGFPVAELQVEWLTRLALFATSLIELYVGLGVIDNTSIEELDERLEPYLRDIFAAQVNASLMPHSEFIDLCASKIALAVELLAQEDREIFLETVKQGPAVRLEDIAELFGVSVQDVLAAWGRIHDTFAVDPVIGDCLFGLKHRF